MRRIGSTLAFILVIASVGAGVVGAQGRDPQAAYLEQLQAQQRWQQQWDQHQAIQERQQQEMFRAQQMNPGRPERYPVPNPDEGWNGETGEAR